MPASSIISSTKWERTLENIKSHREYLAGLRERLDGSRVEQIDFDELSEKLGELESLLAVCERYGQELETLREDYTSRIAGMIKAIAAVDRKREAPRLALRELEGLPSLSGRELVECYRRTSAKFRDAFPTSFGPRTSGTTISRTRDINAYK